MQHFFQVQVFLDAVLIFSGLNLVCFQWLQHKEYYQQDEM